MTNYRKLAEEALNRAKNNSHSEGNSGSLARLNKLTEGVNYADGLGERMHPQIEKELKERNHSLSGNPILPTGDDSHFEEKILGERFDDVCRRYKRSHDSDIIDTKQVILDMMPLVNEAMQLEDDHKSELEKLAVKMIREEYDMDDDVVEINAKLTSVIDMVGTKLNPKPTSVSEMEFSNHDEMVNSTNEIHKRRFLNAMTQGAAKKCNHMFHMVDEELTKIDPRLPNKYSKMMSAADFMYYVIPKMETGVNGGVVKVTFPTKENPKIIIDAQAMVFPVLIHELVKGVMEILSAHGLPKNKKLGNYIINKADYLEAEPWDMRLGPAIWERFTNTIEPDDFNLKHHIYSELAGLPVNEFNHKMREIMAGTKEGKKVISEIVDDIKRGFQQDEFNEAMDTIGKKKNENNDGWSLDDIGSLFE